MEGAGSSTGEYQRLRQEQNELVTILANIIAARTSSQPQPPYTGQTHRDGNTCPIRTILDRHARMSSTAAQNHQVSTSQTPYLLSLLLASVNSTPGHHETRTAIINALEMHTIRQTRRESPSQNGGCVAPLLSRLFSTWDPALMEPLCRHFPILRHSAADVLSGIHPGMVPCLHTNMDERISRVHLSNELISHIINGSQHPHSDIHRACSRSRDTVISPSHQIERPVINNTHSLLSQLEGSIVPCALVADVGAGTVSDALDEYREEVGRGGTASYQSPLVAPPVPARAPKSRRGLSRRSASEATTYNTKDPGEYDVLLGHRKIVFNHPGNAYLKRLVASNRVAYDNAYDRNTKTSITKGIVRHIRNEKQGRFLRYVASENVWSEVSDEDAREKVAHALRDSRR